MVAEMYLHSVDWMVTEKGHCLAVFKKWWRFVLCGHMLHYCGHNKVFDKTWKWEYHVMLATQPVDDRCLISEDSCYSIVSKLGTVCLSRVNDWFWFKAYPSSEMVNTYMSVILKQEKKETGNEIINY